MCTIDAEGLAISLDKSLSMMAHALDSRTLTLRVSIMDTGKRAISQASTVSFYSRESGIGAPTLAMGKFFQIRPMRSETKKTILFPLLMYNTNVHVYYIAFCGDLIVQTGEECDQGPLGGTACSANCTWYRGKITFYSYNNAYIL